MGDGETLLTYLNSELKALLGFDIFPRVPKKKSEILLPSVISCASSWLSLHNFSSTIAEMIQVRLFSIQAFCLRLFKF